MDKKIILTGQELTKIAQSFLIDGDAFTFLLHNNIKFLDNIDKEFEVSLRAKIYCLFIHAAECYLKAALTSSLSGFGIKKEAYDKLLKKNWSHNVNLMRDTSFKENLIGTYDLNYKSLLDLRGPLEIKIEDYHTINKILKILNKETINIRYLYEIQTSPSLNKTFLEIDKVLSKNLNDLFLFKFRQFFSVLFEINKYQHMPGMLFSVKKYLKKS